MNLIRLTLPVFAWLLLTSLAHSSSEVFFPIFNSGPPHQIVRAKDSSSHDLIYSKSSNMRAVNDFDALDVRIKYANGHGGTNRIVFLGEIGDKGEFVMSGWYIICPFLDDRPKDEIPERDVIWNSNLTDRDFANIVHSPFMTLGEFKRDYVIKDGEYCKFLSDDPEKAHGKLEKQPR